MIGCSRVSFVLLATVVATLAQGKLPADALVVGAVPYPFGLLTNSITPAIFESLRAEYLVEQIKAKWQPASAVAQTPVALHYSADAPGHWPARDWRTVPMTLRGPVWEAIFPVEELDVPFVYFVSVGAGAPALLSPMRVVLPRALGMEKPSRVFWPFLDGFEEGISGWAIESPAAGDPSLKHSRLAHDGNAALAVALPVGTRSVTVGTPRVRGWHYSHQLATGLRVWLRAPGGSGRARFALHAHAGTPQAAVTISTIEATLTDKWQRVDLSFSSFPKFSGVGTDWFSIEFSGTGAQEFLVDDLRLLGRWKLPGD